MGPGYAAMNDLVIIQTSQGLAKYLLSTLPDCTKKGVVISYDGRYNSHRLVVCIVKSYSAACKQNFAPFSHNI